MITFLYVALAVSLFAPIYTYAVYPFLLKVIACFFKIEYKVNEAYRPFVSVLIAAYNEEKVIEEKILNLSRLDYPADKIEFLIGSDGSSDRTVEIAKRYLHISNLKVFDLPRGGKVSALNSLLKKAKGEVLVFSDANTMFDSKAILELVKYFTDDRIGCVSGQLRYKIDASSGQGAKSESTYWKYENWVKVLESKIGRLSGANGAIYAIRSGIISGIKKGIINDDFFAATYVLQSGYDVILEPKAIAYEEPNDEFDSQFKRHVRDGAGHYQAIAVFWRMFFPRKGSFVHVSHRVIRWLVPFFLIAAFIFNVVLVEQSVFMAVLFICQMLGYLMMLVYYFGMKKNVKGKKGILINLLNVVFYFFSVNLALLLGFIRLARRQQKATWETQR
jgi:biofilm PGA synthesis N-glycosyltransferase PgaC